MAILADWQRWIVLSCNNHIKTQLTASNIHIHIEGFPRDMEGLKEWFEVRVDVPSSQEQSHGKFKFRIVTDILCVVAIPENAYRLHVLTGLAQAALTNNINLLDEDGVFKEFMRRDPPDSLRVTTFVNKQKATVPQRAAVEAQYRLYVEN